MRLPGRVSAHRLATIAGGLGVAVLAAYLVTPPRARLDDAYIALHSARVLLSGRDPIFGVPALAGATSPIHVAAIAALLGIGVRPASTEQK